MGVNIREAGEEMEPVGVEAPGAPQVLADLGDTPPGDSDVHHPVEAGGRVDDMGAADDEVFGPVRGDVRGSVVRHAATVLGAASIARASTAERTATPEPT